MKTMMKRIFLLALALALALPVLAQAVVIVEWPGGKEIAFRSREEAEAFVNGEDKAMIQHLAQRHGLSTDTEGKPIMYYGDLVTDKNGGIETPFPLSSERKDFRWVVKEDLPRGYMLDGEEFVPLAPGDSVEVKNKKSDYKVKKVDETGKPLKDVEFALYGYPVMYRDPFKLTLKKTAEYYHGDYDHNTNEYVFGPVSTPPAKINKTVIYFVIDYQVNGQTYKTERYSYDQMEAGVTVALENDKETLIIEEFGFDLVSTGAGQVGATTSPPRRYVVDVECRDDRTVKVEKRFQTKYNNMWGDDTSMYGYARFHANPEEQEFTENNVEVTLPNVVVSMTKIK